MTATVMGFWQSDSACSTSFASRMRSMRVRPQVGQAMMFTPSFRSPAAFRMSFAVSTSCTGSAVSDTRIVSPMP